MMKWNRYFDYENKGNEQVYRTRHDDKVSRRYKENGMTAALVEMKVEKKSIRKQEPSSTFWKKKVGHQHGGMVWNAYLLVLNTHAIFSLNTSRLRHTWEMYNWTKQKFGKNKFEAQSTTTFMPIKYLGMIGVVVWLADRCIGNVQNAVR